MTIALDDYAGFVETVPDATLLVNRAGTIVLANTAAEAMFGYEPGRMVGMSVQDLVPVGSRPAHAQHVRNYSEEGGATRAMGLGDKLDLRGLRRDGSQLAVDIMLRPVEVGGERHTVCVVRDISTLKKVEAALQQALERERELAHTDAITGLANVRSFRESIQRELQRFQRYQRPFSLAYLDLDHFKAVNDAQGHQAGDAVLRAVARCLLQRTRNTDVVARLGGDEFAILMPETGAELARTAVTDLQGLLLEAMARGGWPVTFSIGVVTCTEQPESADAVIKQADELMYAAKRAGRNTVRHATYSESA